MPKEVVVEVTEALVIIGVLAALNVGVLLFGKDTRDADDWVQHRW
jgi:hypothetical protein